ncbi:MAG: hypothetical protein WC095_02390 [Candidatus Paceibacterota bacterium]
MSEFQEMLKVDSEDTLRFFFSSLLQVLVNNKKPYKESQLLYVSSVLAHYAQVTRGGDESKPVLAGLTDIFDLFIINREVPTDADILEWGGSQIILFAGFFRDQMRRRHNPAFYDRIGQALYLRASREKSYKQRGFFEELSSNVPFWTSSCCRLSRYLRHQRYLLNN